MEEPHRVQAMKPRPMGKRMGAHMTSHSSKKSKSSGAANPNNFILEEDEEDDDMDDDDLIDANAEAIEDGREDIDERMHKELDQQRRDKDAEDMEKYYTEKYVDRDVGGIRNIESGRQRGINISRTEAMADKEQYLPAIKDPN